MRIHVLLEQLAPPPAPPVSSTSASAVGLLLTAVFSGAVLAALITALINIVLARRKSREEERARLRQAFAEALRAQAAYKEFPYAIRRRSSERPAEERARLTDALREIQAQISVYLAWTAAESQDVGHAYSELVKQTRQVAGTAMKAAWEADPISSDAEMIIPRTVVDLSPLKQAEDAYMQAVIRHLIALAPWQGEAQSRFGWS